MLQKNNLNRLLCTKTTHLASTLTHFFLISTTALTLAACNSTLRDSATISESAPIDQSTPRAAVSAGNEALLSCAINTVELHNELLTLINETRASARLCGDENWPAAPALSASSQLDEAATTHSIDMATQNFFSHTGSNGHTADSRIDAAGYAWTAIGENIAGGQTTTESVVRDWLSSPGHCANIMQSNYTEVGLSCLRNPATDLKWYWTAVFAKPPAN